MSNGYKLIFWGIFIATFNFRFGIMTILPTFIGFIIISSGLNLIIKETHINSFKRAKTYSDILSILLFASGLLPLFRIDLSSHIFYRFIPIVYMSIEILLFYKIFEGAIEKQKLEKKKKSTYDFTNKLSFYLVVSILNTIIMSFSLALNIFWALSITSFIIIILRIFLMTIMNRLKKIYMENPEAH